MPLQEEITEPIMVFMLFISALSVCVMVLLCWKLLCPSAINASWHISECHWNGRGIFSNQTRILLSQIRKFSSHKSLVQAVQCPITITMCNNALLCGVTAASTSKLAFLSPVQVRGLAIKKSQSLESPFSEIIFFCSSLCFLCHCTQAGLFWWNYMVILWDFLILELPPLSHSVVKKEKDKSVSSVC